MRGFVSSLCREIYNKYMYVGLVLVGPHKLLVLTVMLRELLVKPAHNMSLFYPTIYEILLIVLLVWLVYLLLQSKVSFQNIKQPSTG